jgi:methyltransferase-like protein/2-polyprenyl-3-methyl-5-hydroxy-6-metoxy-1,4-benzoquinol methylase
MSADPINSYDEVPYPTRPYYACHPDCFAVMGILLGMTPAPLSRCRVLEIGCSSAGNLIPMALQLPESQFVGLDLSAVQIAAGQETVRDLKIANLDLRAQSVTDVDESWGQFDYIICHGVFSWVPDFVRAKILDICSSNLAPQGIAYISYNTYPGWFARKTLRDVLALHVRRFPTPVERVTQARQFLEFLDKSGLPTDSPSSEALRRLIRDLRDLPDFYFYHEYLEAENQPFYFSEFMAAAQKQGLQYMGNAWQHVDLDLLNPQAKSTLLDVSEDLIQLEQFTDFLVNCPFRRTLLCHGAVALDRSPPASAVAGLYVGALAEPVSPNPDCFSNAPEAFQVDGKKRGTTDQPLTKTMFTVLAEVWPSAIPFETLWTTIESRLAAHNCLTAELAAHGREALAQTLLQSYLGRFASLHVQPFPFAKEPGPRPRASRLVRWQIGKGQNEYSNLRHNLVKLEDIDRILVNRLDGTKTVGQLQDDLAQLVREGSLSFTGDDGEALQGPNLQVAIVKTIETSLGRLAKKSLLEA